MRRTGRCGEAELEGKRRTRRAWAWITKIAKIKNRETADEFNARMSTTAQRFASKPKG